MGERRRLITSEDLWQRIQQAMGYTDEEIAIAKSSPYQRRVLESGSQLVRTKIIGEVVEAKNCVAHGVGARYVMRGNGVVRTADCSESLCINVLSLLAPVYAIVFDRIADGRDLKGFTYFIRCPDTGIECGGFGTALIKVTVE